MTHGEIVSFLWGVADRPRRCRRLRDQADIRAIEADILRMLSGVTRAAGE